MSYQYLSSEQLNRICSRADLLAAVSAFLGAPIATDDYVVSPRREACVMPSQADLQKNLETYTRLTGYCSGRILLGFGRVIWSDREHGVGPVGGRFQTSYYFHGQSTLYVVRDGVFGAETGPLRAVVSG